MLGSKGNTDWLDLSDYVVHFTKGGDDAGYKTIMSILGDRVLIRGSVAFGAAREISEVAESQRCVCFSEVPLGFLERLASRRRSSYGIIFTKQFLLEKGGAPLWYLEQGTAPQQAMVALIKAHRSNGTNPGDPLWTITPLVDFPSGPTSSYKYDFRWEREWRVASDVAFIESDVAALLIPEHLHDNARGFFMTAVNENIGPGYFCPYIDPTWSVEHVRAALSSSPQSSA